MANGMDAATAGKLIKAARDEPVSFAFALGNGDGAVLEVDPRKSPNQLLAVAKRQAGGGKAACGIVLYDGSVAVFEADHPMSGMAKLIQEWFKQGKVSLNCKSGVAKARDSDEDEEEEVPDANLFGREIIFKRIKMARRRTMYFACGAEADVYLALHPIKKPKPLSLIVKREAGVSRVAFGHLVINRRIVEFHCDQKPLPGLRRKIRAKFKDWKFPLEVKIFGPDGEASEEEEEAARNAPELAALGKELAQLLPRLRKAAKLATPHAGSVIPTYRSCEKAIKAGDLEAARAAMARLREFAREEEQIAKAVVALRDELKALVKRLKPIVAGDASQSGPIRDEYAACEKALKVGAVAPAQQHLNALRRLAEQGEKAAKGP